MPPSNDHPETSHAFADNSDRFARDVLLRKYGFQIMARPNNAPARWVKAGRVYTFKAALKELPASLVRDARHQEDGYYEDTYPDWET